MKRHLEKTQEIHRRTPAPKCDPNKATVAALLKSQSNARAPQQIPKNTLLQEHSQRTEFAFIQKSKLI